MQARNKIYFASDFHLGVPDEKSSRLREQRIVRWLNSIQHDAAELFLMGDIFDFWFEYKTVVPKGYIRLLGKLAEMSDAGTKLYFFKGNHDMWMFDYLPKELGAVIIDDELEIERNGKKFYLHHGDGLGPGDAKFKILKKFFRSSFCQWLFARLHPNLGIGIASAWSKRSRMANNKKEVFRSEDEEWLATYAKEVLQSQFYDYLIFGHRHLPLDILINGKSRYVNIGEWIFHSSYAVFDGEDLRLEYFEPEESI